MGRISPFYPNNNFEIKSLLEVNLMIYEIYKKRHIYLFLLPALAILIIFGYYPAVQAFALSFQNDNGIFVGLENFIEIAQDKVLINSVWNMLLLLAVSLVTSNIPSLLMAELLCSLRNRKASDIYRYFFIIPMLIPWIVIILVWTNLILEPNVGLMNAILGLLGLEPLGWMGEINTALASLMLIGFPWIAGTNLLIYIAGIQGISQGIIEASVMDGANFITRFIRIDIPLVLGQIKLLFILGIIGGIQAFQLQLMTTNGDPAYATMVPGLWMYQQAFSYSRFGYSSAIGFILFIVIFLLSTISNKYIESEN